MTSGTSPRSAKAGIWVRSLLFGIVATLCTRSLFAVIYDFGPLFSDLPLHVQLLIDSKAKDLQLGYSSYYALLDIISGQSLGIADLRTATVTLLATATGLRGAVAYLVMELAGARFWLAGVISSAIIVMAPLALPGGGDLVYLGKFSPSIWHNSTTIVALPFCLALFLFLDRYLTGSHPRPWLHFAVPATILLCAAAKPNYVLAVAPAVALWMSWKVASTSRPDRPREVRRLALPAAVIGVTSIVVLGFMFWSTFGGSGIAIQGKTVSLGVRPGVVWSMLTPNQIWSLIASFIAPAAATIAVRRQREIGPTLPLAWLTSAIAVTQFVVFAEVLSDGKVLGHANWIWGAHMSTFVLYIVCTASLVKHWKMATSAKWVAVSLAILQTVIGVLFLFLVVSGIAPTHVRF